VLVGGNLQGVGAPNEIVSLAVHGMEILFELSEGQAVPSGLGDQVTHTGNRYRVVVPESALYGALDQLEQVKARILAVTPLRDSLEDYFFKLVGKEKFAPHAVEVMTR